MSQIIATAHKQMWGWAELSAFQGVALHSYIPDLATCMPDDHRAAQRCAARALAIREAGHAAGDVPVW